MKNQLPDIDLPVEFVAGTLDDDEILSRYDFPCRIHAAMFVLCVRGELEAIINLHDSVIGPADLVTLLPGTIIQFKRMKPGTELKFMGYSSGFFKSMGLVNNHIDFVTAASRRPVLRLGENMFDIFTDYFTLVQKAWSSGEIYNEEMLKGALVISVMTVRNQYQRNRTETEVSASRGEKLYKELVGLIMRHFEKEKRVGFYAGQLNVTPQHLSSTVRKVSGKTVSDLIAEIVVADAKAKLRSTSMNIQQISYSLNFPNASFFGKFFKRYTGMSPREYRFTETPEI